MRETVMYLIGLAIFPTVLAAQVASAPDYPALPSQVSDPAQWATPGWQIISWAKGDLNRDRKPDVALALGPTGEAARLQGPSAPHHYRLIVGLSDADGGFTLVTDNRRLLAEVPGARTSAGPLGAEDLTISNGKLLVARSFPRGKFSHAFRWSGSDFLLTNYMFDGSSEQCSTHATINYDTRRAKIVTTGLDGRAEERRFERRVTRAPVSMEEMAAEGYSEYRDLDGSPSYCKYRGARI